MKKITILYLLVLTFIFGVSTSEAKTTKKKSKAKSTSSVICSFKYNDSASGDSRYKVTFSLLSNGKVKATSKCFTGNFVKLKGAYKVTLEDVYCGDSCWEDLIVGDYVYSIGGATDGDTVHDFTFNPSDKTVTIINTSDMSDREFKEWNNLPLLTLPLSHFERVGKVTWTK